MGDRPTGFRLTISNLTSNDTAILHEDDSIPRSRGCPITYRISRIVAPDAWPVEQVVVVLSVLRHGFEGADRRFIAIPGRCPDEGRLARRCGWADAHIMTFSA
jgi:predicted secreted protein